MALVYITLEQAVETHRKTVEVSGGGALGAMNLGPLESVLEHIQNDLYYPEFEDKLTHLFFSANKFHCFQDGNKRIAISLGAQFLLLNGYVFVASRFMREMENISYHVAAGRIDKVLLKEIISAVIEDGTDDEELKMKIFHAISQGDDE
jgi:death-on-curing protein